MRYLVFCVVSFFWCIDLFGQTDTLYVKEAKRSYRLNGHFNYYIDNSGRKTFQEIASLPDTSFSSLNGQPLRRPLTDDHIWLTGHIKNELDHYETFIIEFNDPSIYSLALYEANGATYEVSRSGTSVPQAQRDEPGSKNIFSVSLEPDQTVDIYLVISSKTSITIDARLEQQRSANARYLNEHALLGVYYGVMLLFVLYSFMIFLATKFRVLLIYALYVISVGAFTAVGDGFFIEYVHWFVMLSNGYHDILFFVISSLMGIIFMIEFLKLKRWHLRFYRFSIAYAILVVITTLLLFVVSKPLMLKSAELIGLMTISIFIYGGIIAVRRKVSQAKYYLLAHCSFGFFVLIFVLSQLRIIPFNQLVQYAIHLGYISSFLIISFSFYVGLSQVYQQLLNKEKEKQDIIKQKNAELEAKVAERTADIAEKEVNLRSILDNNDNSIWLIDKHYNLIDFNVVFNNLWQHSYDAKLSRGSNIMELMPDEALKEKWKSRYDNGLSGKSDVYIDSYEIAESTHHYEIKSFPIREGKKIVGVAFFSKDITARLQSEKQLKAQNKMLKKANKELDSFVYSASHDLKAPLASVLGLIGLVKTENNLETRLHYYELMEKSVVRLDRFIKDIIDYSRNERTEIKYTTINLEDLVSDVFDDLKYLNGTEDTIKNTRINVNKTFASDPTRVRVIVRNLISNAIRYGCAPLVKQKQIDIEADVDDEKLTLIVKDYGPGMKPEHQQHIFEMFYRAHETSTGTGLGLYIVKETVNKLKGSIEVESTVGQGAVFTVTIPNKIGRLSD